MNDWPIKPVVVLTNPNKEIRYGWNDDSPQTDVIDINQFANWLSGLPKNSKIDFSKQDFERLYNTIKSYEKGYQPAA